MSSSSWPNFNLFIEGSWAPGGSGSASGWPVGWGFGAASNVVVGANPPYSATDFLSIYPAFGGDPILLAGTITQGLQIVTDLQTTAGILPGQPVSPVVPQGNTLSAGAFPDGTIVLSVDSATQLTMSQPATRDFNIVAIYNAPFVPFQVLAAYIFLATSSLQSARYCEMWPLAMAFFIAHYSTLYLRTCGTPAFTGAQLAAQGLARGIQTSKSAGPVSVGITPSTAGGTLADWGSFTETEFGVQLATIMRGVGAGPLWVW